MERQQGGKDEEQNASSGPMPRQPEARGPDCPTLEEWGLFEAGALPEDRSLDLVEHASTCGACGSLLAGLRGGTEESDATLLLKSSTLEWKRDMLKQIAASQSADRRFRVRPVWIGVAAAIVAAVGGSVWWVNRVNSPEAAFHMLAQAYSQQRPFELRIPGAAHSPVRVQRGSALAAPVEMAEAEALIGRKLQASPDSAPWLRARARADLLQMRYGSAIENLRKAQETEPQNPDALGDLGIAYLQRAEAETRPQDAAQAVEFLSQAIDARPRDATLRFNRALAYEQIAAPKAAVEEWNQFLQLESSGEWAAEAREHLAHDEELLRKQAARAGHAPAEADLEPGAPEVFDLLAHWNSPGSSGSLENPELQRLASRFQTAFGDWWLADLIASLRHRPSSAALDGLVKAEVAGGKGDPATEFQQAQSSLPQFRKLENTAGVLRAQYELLYSFQRSSRAQECLRAGEALSSSLEHTRYPWLKSQALLERAGCANMAGDFESANRWTEEAIAGSRQHSLKAQLLRGIGIRAVALASMGNWPAAWELDQDGLRTFWSGEYPPARAYQFYYTMSSFAQDHDFPFLARSLAEDAVTQISLTGNVSTEAMARIRLAHLHLQARKSEVAKAEILHAAELFRQLPPSKEKSLYEADGDIGLALIEARGGDPGAALRRLDAIQDRLHGVANQNVSVSFFRTRAEVEHRSGNAQAYERDLRALAAVAAAGLQSLGNSQDRLTWLHELDHAYRGLVRASLDRKDTSTALDIWESYRALDARPSGGAPVAVDIDSLEKTPSLRPFVHTGELGGSLPRSTVLTFVPMDDGVAAWRTSRSGVTYRWIPLAAGALASLAADFTSACASPRSPERALQDRGKRLYDSLVAPLLPDAGLHEVLVIDADGPVAQIPFEALPLPDGSFLGDRTAVVESPGVFYYREEQPDWAREDASALVVGEPSLGTGWRDRLPALPDAREEAAQVGAMFPNHILLTGAAATADAVERGLQHASIFHFAGHALSSEEQAGLVLADAGDPEAGVSGLWNARTLRSARFPHCRLVVLSACATNPMGTWGVAEPGSLARALLSAGVTHVVASRWPVDSGATRALMSQFYARLKHGESPAGALAGARRAVRQVSATSHPYYWAAFSAFGNL
ncbi:MAG TPA: CHAT domain-containing protein [Bryobacteraceae bacterium]